MKLCNLVTIVTLSSAASTWSIASPRQNTQQVITLDDRKNPIPGNNPLEFCDEPSEYLLEIDQVDLLPNPPKAGQTLSIQAQGILKEKVEEGAYVAITVKYGLITLIKQTIDLCEQVKNVDLECPLEAGDLKLTKDVDLPKEIPPGMYTVNANVFTKDDEQITCLTAKVRFSRGG